MTKVPSRAFVARAPRAPRARGPAEPARAPQSEPIPLRALRGPAGPDLRGPAGPDGGFIGEPQEKPYQTISNLGLDPQLHARFTVMLYQCDFLSLLGILQQLQVQTQTHPHTLDKNGSFQ